MFGKLPSRSDRCHEFAKLGCCPYRKRQCWLGWQQLREDVTLSGVPHLVNSPIEWFQTCPCEMSMCVLSSQTCTNWGHIRGLRPFTCKFPQKVALPTCPCAFKLRRLAQSQQSHTEILPRDLLRGASTEILPRDLRLSYVLESNDPRIEGVRCRSSVV